MSLLPANIPWVAAPAPPAHPGRRCQGRSSWPIVAVERARPPPGESSHADRGSTARPLARLGPAAPRTLRGRERRPRGSSRPDPHRPGRRHAVVTLAPPPGQGEPDAEARPGRAAAPQYSRDGLWYWDGQQGRPMLAPGPARSWPYETADGRAAAVIALIALATVPDGVLAAGGALYVSTGRFLADSVIQLAV